MLMKLSEQILIEVCQKSLENARELIGEADLLKENQKIARSYTLYQLATEEVGKAIYCYLIIFQKQYDDPAIKLEFDKVFRSHKIKTDKSSSLNIMIAQVLYKGNFEGAMKFLEETIEEGKQLNHINDFKNYSLYTSIVDSNVKNPSEIITERHLANIELKAKSRFGATNAFVKVGIEHLESLRKYQNENPEFKPDAEDYAKKFWNELMQ